MQNFEKVFLLNTFLQIDLSSWFLNAFFLRCSFFDWHILHLLYSLCDNLICFTLQACHQNGFRCNSTHSSTSRSRWNTGTLHSLICVPSDPYTSLIVNRTQFPTSECYKHKLGISMYLRSQAIFLNVACLVGLSYAYRSRKTA